MERIVFGVVAASLVLGAGCLNSKKKKPPIGISAMRFTIGSNPVLEVRVTNKWIMVGRRGIVKSKKGVSGTVDKRADNAEERAKLRPVKLPRWKLERKGGQLVGMVAGHAAKLTIKREDKTLEMKGRVGLTEVEVKQTHYNLRISVDDMTLDFGRELSGSTGGDRTWMASDGCCRLSVSRTVLNRTGTLPELALLVFALEMSSKNQIVDEKVHPGWDDALTDEKKKKK